MSKAKPLTVKNVLDLYLRHAIAENVHSASSRAAREKLFRDFQAFQVAGRPFGDFPVSELKPFHLRDFIAAQPSWKSVATRRCRADEIKAPFNWALKEERVDRNPFAFVRYDKGERGPCIPEDALSDVLYAINKPAEAILRFIRLTGCRVSEVCRAQWADVDLDNGTWTIHVHKTRKRTGKPKVVALVPAAVELLQAIAAVRRSLRTREGTIFLTTHGRPWSTSNLWKCMKRAKRRAGVTARGAMHAIRHLYATTAVANGAPVALVAAQLGHSSSKITEQYYVDLSTQMDAIRAAAELAMPTGSTPPRKPPSAPRAPRRRVQEAPMRPRLFSPQAAG